MARAYKLISADSHLDLNPDVWAHRVAAKWRDRAPKRVKMPNGSDAVVVDGGEPNTVGVTRSVGIAHKDLAKQVPTFESSAGTGPPEQRVSEQDRDGVEAEILYSQIQPVLRQARDDQLYLDLVRAYNDYLAEEYSAASPDRLIPMGLMPMTNVDDAIQDAFAQGLRGKLPSEVRSVEGWLFVVALNKIKRTQRRGLRFVPLRREEQSADAIDAANTRVDVLARLETLSQRERELLVAKFYVGLTQDELAAALGLPRGTVSSAISRAAARFRAAGGER